MCYYIHLYYMYVCMPSVYVCASVTRVLNIAAGAEACSSSPWFIV